MGFASVTTALFAAFAAFVVFVRLKGWIESNVPLLFYVALVSYMQAIQGAAPLWLICTGFGLTLLLRFEFMNPFFIRAVKSIEIVVLGAIIYLCVTMIV